MTGKDKSILISEICIAVSACTFFPLLWKHAYYHLMAVAHVLLWWFIMRVTQRHKVAQIGFWFSVNALIDELFFDPAKIGINEYIFAVVILFLIILRKHKSNGTDTRRRNNRITN